MKIFMSSANVNVQDDRAGLEGSGADHGGSHPVVPTIPVLLAGLSVEQEA